ncbi:MAG: hypothetical protein LZF60_380151 [Nitrospira sp.]|nr:PilZ domain-containing protein [Nitrospira sp.]ULA61939.1 MAG: hypothetical protein LZF60_380151 [Nitrospira sp.]
MTRDSIAQFVLHGNLSADVIGCAELVRLFVTERGSTLRTTSHRLIDGDFLAMKLHLPEEGRAVSVNLAKVAWVQEERFGVELLIIDTDARDRLGRFLGSAFPLQIEIHEPQSGLTINAAD